MKHFKTGLKIIATLLLISGVLGYFFLQSLAPIYKGDLELADLSSTVTVAYDATGVPHIEANNKKDAYTTLGYVHAQDRLWQMEVIRRIAPGRLSEIFGEKTLKTDVFFSGLGIEEAAALAIKELDTLSESYQLSQAYLNGINQFIANGPTPLEFYLVGVEKELYTLKDVYNVFGFMAFSFAIAHKTDPLLTSVKETLGPAYLAELEIPVGPETTLIKNHKTGSVNAGYAREIHALFDALPVAPFIGSNSWVVGADKTKNGKVILVNDPHIGFAQPAVWYQSHIKTPDYEMYGFNLALTPFSLLGHNREYAYGITMFENDDVDFYIEKNNPANAMEYRTPNGYQTYELREKRLRIKGRKDTVYQQKISRHGPIMNGLGAEFQEERPVAMQWIYTKLKSQLLTVSFDMSHASSLASFKEGASKLHAPGLNIMYGDAAGNIAWFATGTLYKYKDGVSSKLLLDGASGAHEIEEFLDFSENPQAVNPPWNYVYSANNQPDSIAGMLYPGYYLPEDRAKRIVNLLEAKNDITKEDMATMIYDVTSSVAPKIITDLSQAIVLDSLSEKEKQQLKRLQEWDGAYQKESVGATIYTRFVYEFLAGTYKDELKDHFTPFLKTRLHKKLLAVQAAKDASIWWDDMRTSGIQETKKMIVTNAFKSTLSFLENQLGSDSDTWTWSRVASVEYEHFLGKVPLLRKLFNVGPFKTVGGREVINNQLFHLDSTGVYKIMAGPSTRRIIDFSDVENSLGILPTGQSGNRMSPHYKDQAQQYLDGKFVKMMLNPEEIAASKNKLILQPKK